MFQSTHDFGKFDMASRPKFGSSQTTAMGKWRNENLFVGVLLTQYAQDNWMLYRWLTSDHPKYFNTSRHNWIRRFCQRVCSPEHKLKDKQIFGQSHYQILIIEPFLPLILFLVGKCIDLNFLVLELKPKIEARSFWSCMGHTCAYIREVFKLLAFGIPCYTWASTL